MNVKKQEIRKRVCGSLNGWEYWALFEDGVMISPWMCTIDGAEMFQAEYNKGILPPESINVRDNIDYAHRDFSDFVFDHKKEEGLYHLKDAKVAAADNIE